MNTPNSPIALFSHSLESAFLALATAASLLPQVVAELQTSTAQVPVNTTALKLDIDTSAAVEKLADLQEKVEAAKAATAEDLQPVVSPNLPLPTGNNFLHVILLNVFRVKGTKSFSAPKAAAEEQNVTQVAALGGVDGLIKALEDAVAQGTEFSMPSADGTTVDMYTLVKAGGIIKNMYILKPVPAGEVKKASTVVAKKETVSGTSPVTEPSVPLASSPDSTPHDVSELVGAAYRAFGTTRFSPVALVASAQFQRALFLDPDFASSSLPQVHKKTLEQLEALAARPEMLRVRTGDQAYRYVQFKPTTGGLFVLADNGAAR